jgi:hypothetical protein
MRTSMRTRCVVRRVVRDGNIQQYQCRIAGARAAAHGWLLFDTNSRPGVRQGEAAGVPAHVRMDLKADAGIPA